jgi:glycosyltransferase involved in cell wall biosynthesis
MTRRIALLQEYFPPAAPGGAEWSGLALAENLAARGVRVAVVTLDLAGRPLRGEAAAIDERLRARGVRVVRLPFPAKLNEPRVFPSYVLGNPAAERWIARGLARFCRDWRPDLLHAQGLDMLTPAWRVAWRERLPLLFTVRDFRALCPVDICLHRRDLPPPSCDRAQFRACSAEFLAQYGPDFNAAARLRYRLRRELEWRAQQRR